MSGLWFDQCYTREFYTFQECSQVPAVQRILRERLHNRSCHLDAASLTKAASRAVPPPDVAVASAGTPCGGSSTPRPGFRTAVACRCPAPGSRGIRQSNLQQMGGAAVAAASGHEDNDADRALSSPSPAACGTGIRKRRLSADGCLSQRPGRRRDTSTACERPTPSPIPSSSPTRQRRCLRVLELCCGGGGLSFMQHLSASDPEDNMQVASQGPPCRDQMAFFSGDSFGGNVGAAAEGHAPPDLPAGGAEVRCTWAVDCCRDATASYKLNHPDVHVRGWTGCALPGLCRWAGCRTRGRGRARPIHWLCVEAARHQLRGQLPSPGS